MDHQVAAAAPDGDEVALHSRAHETNQSIQSGGQFGQVCDVVVVPAILGASSGGRQKRPRNRPSLEWGWFFGRHNRYRDSVIDLLEEGGVEGKEQGCDRQEVGKRERGGGGGRNFLKERRRDTIYGEDLPTLCCFHGKSRHCRSSGERSRSANSCTISFIRAVVVVEIKTL